MWQKIKEVLVAATQKQFIEKNWDKSKIIYLTVSRVNRVLRWHLGIYGPSLIAANPE